MSDALEAALTPMIHKACGGIAFYFDRPGIGEPLLSSRTRLVDGTSPLPCSPLACGAGCGLPVEMSGPFGVRW